MPEPKPETTPKASFARMNAIGKHDDFSFIRLCTFLIAIIMFLAYYLGRVGMGETPNFLPPILSITIILLPQTLQLFSSLHTAVLQAAVILFFFVLGWISILLRIDLTIILYLTFFLSLFVFIRNKGFTIGGRRAIKIFSIIFFALELVSLVWTQDYMNPLSPEAFAIGLRFVHVDTLFLSTLTSNIKNYQAASLGLFGLEPYRYHLGSNYLFASYVQLCKIGTLQFYNLAFPVIFVPLFFQNFLYAAFAQFKSRSSERRVMISFLFFFFVVCGFLPPSIGSLYLLPSAVNSHFLSQSYCLSLVFTFLFICIYSPLLQTNRLHKKLFVHVVLILLIPCWFCVIGYTKLSTGVVIFAAFFYLVLRRGLITQISVFVSITLTSIVLFYVLHFTVESNENTFIIQFGSFYKMFVRGNVFLYFLLNYWWLLLLMVSVFLICRKKDQKFFSGLISGKFIVIELLLVASIVGIIPGLLIHIEGGSALYFSDIQYWLSAIAFIHIVPYFAFKHHNLKGKLRLYFRIVSFIALVIITRESVFRSFYYFLKKNIRIRTALVYGKENTFLQQVKLIDLAPVTHKLVFGIKESDKFKEQIQGLNITLFDELRRLPASIMTNSLVYCEDPAELEKFLPCSAATFYITAMSEMAMINGLYWKDCFPTGGYGMQNYFSYPKEISKDDAFELARKNGCDNMIVINLKNHSFQMVRL